MRDVQKTLTGNCEFIQGPFKSFEMVRGGLVGLDILGGDDLVELNAQPRVAAGKTLMVHIGQDDQFVVLGQGRQRIV